MLLIAIECHCIKTISVTGWVKGNTYQYPADFGSIRNEITSYTCPTSDKRIMISNGKQLKYNTNDECIMCVIEQSFLNRIPCPNHQPSTIYHSITIYHFSGIPDHAVVLGNPNLPCETKWAVSVR